MPVAGWSSKIRQLVLSYGMPRSAGQAGAADCVAPLPEIPSLVARLLKVPAANYSDFILVRNRMQASTGKI